MKRILLDNGNIWQKSDGRWIGMVRYKDEYGVTQRKSFSCKKKKTLQAKMTEYVKNFNEQVANSDESRKPLKESMKNWLRVYKYPEVERTTYDRYECTAEHQIYPYIGNKPVGDVTPADIKKLLTKHMYNGYAFTTSKKAYSLLKMFFKQLYQEGAIPNNPMALIDMTKKDNYLAAQNKESKPQCDLVVVFTDEELEKIKEEAFKIFANGKPVYQQAASYFLMLNTGLRAGELCGIIIYFEEANRTDYDKIADALKLRACDVDHISIFVFKDRLTMNTLPWLINGNKNNNANGFVDVAPLCQFFDDFFDPSDYSDFIQFANVFRDRCDSIV